MADTLRQVRVQLINEQTGEVIESVDVKTSPEAVILSDGTTLAQHLETFATKEELTAHVNDADVHVSKELRDQGIINVAVEDATGIITFTRYDQSTFTVDTKLEKVVTNFALGEDGESLDLTLEDGTVQNVSLAAFIDVYNGSTGDKIAITVTDSIDPENPGKVISGTIVGNSIIWDDLSAALQEIINNKVDKVEGKGLSTNDLTDELKAKYDAATKVEASETNGNIKVDGTETTVYTLPTATADALGGVKSGGDITVNADGTMTSNKTSVKVGTTYETATNVGLFLKVEEVVDTPEETPDDGTDETGEKPTE